MPVRIGADFQLDGKPFMLARGQFKGRAWRRTGTPDSPGRRLAADVRWGQLPDEIDHPEVWDDWSGGFGDAYRDPEHPNRYHWAENFDPRFPHQLVHAQVFRAVSSVIASPYRSSIYIDPNSLAPGVAVVEASVRINCNALLDIRTLGSTWGQAAGDPDIPGHLRSVMMLGKGWWSELVPQDHALSGYDFNLMNAFVEGTTGGLYAGTGVQFCHRPVVTASYILLPVSTGTGFQTVNRAAVFNNASAGSLAGRAFAVVGKHIWRAAQPAAGGAADAFYLQNCDVLVPPTIVANWGATYYIEGGQFPVQDLVGHGEQVAASTARGLYVGDSSGTFINVLSEAGMQSHPENGRDLAVWQGSVIYPHVGGLWAYWKGDFSRRIKEIGPLGKLSNKGPIQGRIRAVRGHGQWLLAGLYTGSVSHLLAGRADGDEMIWHSLNRLPIASEVNRLHVDGAIYASNGTPLPARIWLATEQISLNGVVWWMPIPPGFGNPLAPAMGFSPNYMGSARMDFGATDWGSPGTPKVFRAVELWADNLASAAQYAKVYYTVDTGSRQLLGTVAKSPKDTLYFPSSAASWCTGQSIALSIESFTASYGITPVYRSVVLRGALRPRSVDQVMAVVRIADNLRDRRGGVMRPGAVQLSELRTLAVSASPVQLVDLAGATSWVIVQAPVEETEVYQQGEEEPEIAATVQMSILTFS